MSHSALSRPTCSLFSSTCKQHNNNNNNRDNDSDSYELAGFSKRLFCLTAYSLMSAALMGSSIGIVVFQSQQMTMFSPAATTVGATAAGPGPEPEPCPTPLSQYPWSSFSTTLISAWIPLTVWLVTLLATTVLVQQKQFVPRMVSARHVILISQAVFGVFWVLIASVQEVQDQMLLLTISITAPKTETVTIAQGEEDALFVLHQQRQRPQVQALELSHTNAQTYTAQSIQMPLCVVWYMAVMLLGLATGLMTTSSMLLERQLERDLSEFSAQASTTTQGDNKHQHQQNIDEKGIVCASPSSASPTWSLNRMRRYSCMQRTMLGILVLALFSLQMLFFQWIIASSAATIGEAATEGRILTSTCLALFGLLSSMTMMALGAKLVPAVHERCPQIAI